MPSSPIEFPYIYRLGGTRRVLIPMVQADVQLPFVYHPIRPLLLGREGFFDLFNITFDNRRKKVVLTPLF